MVGFSNSLLLKQKQSTLITPELQQAIRMMQLSTMELKQEIRQAVIENPFLEMEEFDSFKEESYESLQEKENAESLTDFDIFSDDASVNNSFIDGADSYKTISENGILTKESTASENTNTQENLQEHYQDSYSAGTHGSTKNYELSFDTYEGETEETLQEHLTWQLELSPLTGRDKLIAQLIIDGIDDNGYLTESLEDIKSVTQQNYPDTELDDILSVLKLIQHYDPLGVGSRSVQENLLIQLNNLPKNTEYLNLAKEIIENSIELLSNHDYRGLCQKHGLKENHLKKIDELIKGLNPRPGNFKPQKRPEFVEPDVLVKKLSNDEYGVELYYKPKVMLNESYRQLASKAQTKSDKDYFKSHEQEANFFIKSIENRNNTLLKVAQCIVKYQKDFMEIGPSAMHPLVLNDIAQEIQMHESTISRITNKKYIATPKGIFSLKYFFSSSIANNDGDSVSSTAIKAKIKELIDNENKRKPLSDSKIADELTKSGITAARRTVAKYREAMGILSSSQRKLLI